METISFATDGLGPDLIPDAELADCAGTALDQDGARILSYGTGAGYTPLRELLGERYGIHPYRIVLTNGWLQGFAMLAQARALGQNVVAEYPTYDGALQLLFGLGANLVFADVRETGLALDELEVQVRVQRPSLAYTIPTFHNPTGQSLSLDERIRLCSILRRTDALVIEDDTYAALRYEGDPIPTVFEILDQTTVYSTSFSTTIAPGLRVGVFILPDKLAGEFATQANSTYITPALLGQATVFEFIRRGSYDAHLDRLKTQLAERRDALLAALDRHADGCRWSKPEGGIFVLLYLPPGTDASKVIERAEGVTALAGSEFGAAPNAVRLNFAQPALAEIESGIERLTAALELLPEP